MSERDAERLDRQIHRISAVLPDRLRRFIRGLKGRSSHWVRFPVGLLLIIGGLLGFLPIFGFWMVPFGALLLAQDVPFLRRPMLFALVWLKRTWTKWRRRPKP